MGRSDQAKAASRHPGPGHARPGHACSVNARCNFESGASITQTGHTHSCPGHARVDDSRPSQPKTADSEADRHAGEHGGVIGDTPRRDTQKGALSIYGNQDQSL